MIHSRKISHREHREDREGKSQTSLPIVNQSLFLINLPSSSVRSVTSVANLLFLRMIDPMKEARAILHLQRRT
jgi:hypothetical protein